MPYPTPKLEDIDVLVADHVQRVHKTNFLASWDEIGDECEMQDTYALTQMNSLEGKHVFKHFSSFFPFHLQDNEKQTVKIVYCVLFSFAAVVWARHAMMGIA